MQRGAERERGSGKGLYGLISLGFFEQAVCRVLKPGMGK